MKLTAENTAIVLDSTADFPQAPERFPNWRIVPLYVRFGDESFRDYVDLSPDAFYAKLRDAPVPPATSQPTPGDFLAVYEELVEVYERVLSLQLSSTLSGTHASAETAAGTVGGAVRVVDTRTVSGAIAVLALAVQRRLVRGSDDAELDDLFDSFRSSHGLLATLETLEYLARGGRIGRARAWAGELLSIKPILSLRDGEVLPVKRVRGNRKAFLEFASAFENGSQDVPTLRVGIAHADAPERAAARAERVQRSRPAAELEVVTMLGPVLGAHAGPGTVGFFWFDDPM